MDVLTNSIFAFIFDSGRLNDMCYGEVVFKYMLKEKELTRNPSKMIVSLGDILIYKRYIDIEPYVVKDEYCTIDFDAQNNTTPFKDYPYCWIVEDLSVEIAQEIDKRLKETLVGYVGLSRIGIQNASTRQQFWKNMIREFALFQDTITCFQDPELEGEFMYSETATEMGYRIEYQKDNACIEESASLQSSHIKSDDDLEIKQPRKKDMERDLLTLNFSIRQELQISGVLIWRSINDLDKVRLYSEDQYNEQLIEYPFLALYHCSQGVERIQKAIIELICKKNHIEEKEKDEVYDLLFSHSHDKLNQWIEQQEKITFSKNCRKLINILVKFYNSVRYARYSDDGCNKTTAPEYQLLLELKNKNSSDLDSDIKNIFGRCLGELCHIYFNLYYELCNDLNIYAYELEYDSAAAIVYHINDKPVNLYEKLKQRQNAKKEVLYWLIKKARQYPKFSIAKEAALKFDPEMIEGYLSDLIFNPEDGYGFFDEVDCLYDDLCAKNKAKWLDRLEMLNYIIDREY